MFAVATPMAASRRVQIRPLPPGCRRWRTSSDGSVSGRSAGSVKSSKLSRAAPGGRQLARQHRQRVLRERQLLAQRRQLRLVAGELRARGQHVAACHLARVELALHQLEAALVVDHDVLDRLDLRAQRCDRDGLGDGVARERDPRGRQLVALRLHQRLLLLDAASHAAEDVHQVAGGGADRVERRAILALEARAGALELGLVLPVGAGVDLGIEGAARGLHELARLRQRRARLGQLRLSESALHHLVGAGERRDPTRPTRSAARAGVAGRCPPSRVERLGRRRVRVARHIRGVGAHEVRTHGAAAA